MPTALITGASRGLGLEFTRQYAADGWRVFAACRNPAKADALRDIESGAGGRVQVRALDVTDHAQIDALARELDGEAIDLLLNNAGVMEPHDVTFGNIDYDMWAGVFETNLLAPTHMAEAFVEHVARSERKLIVTLSSGLGSITINRPGERLAPGNLYMYRTSKSAVNMVMHGLSFELKERGITAVVVSPGHVRTDMGGPQARLGIEESIASVRDVIGGLSVADSGKFLFYNGEEHPW
jgi:NAD(P)-dependent dehydrogenase (short-subunit alcohol dehydrogenase family)